MLEERLNDPVLRRRLGVLKEALEVGERLGDLVEPGYAPGAPLSSEDGTRTGRPGAIRHRPAPLESPRGTGLDGTCFRDYWPCAVGFGAVMLRQQGARPNGSPVFRGRIVKP